MIEDGLGLAMESYQCEPFLSVWPSAPGRELSALLSAGYSLADARGVYESYIEVCGKVGGPVRGFLSELPSDALDGAGIASGRVGVGGVQQCGVVGAVDSERSGIEFDNRQTGRALGDVVGPQRRYILLGSKSYEYDQVSRRSEGGETRGSDIRVFGGACGDRTSPEGVEKVVEDQLQAQGCRTYNQSRREKKKSRKCKRQAMSRDWRDRKVDSVVDSGYKGGFWKAVPDETRIEMMISKAKMHVAQNELNAFLAKKRLQDESSGVALVREIVSQAKLEADMSKQKIDERVTSWARTVVSDSAVSLAKSAPDSTVSFESLAKSLEESQTLQERKRTAELEKKCEELEEQNVALVRNLEIASTREADYERRLAARGGFRSDERVHVVVDRKNPGETGVERIVRAASRERKKRTSGYRSTSEHQCAINDVINFRRSSIVPC